ncbi:RNA polymerase-associated protein RapA [Candidatus Entotheonellaceae bacterium PAL068K]
MENHPLILDNYSRTVADYLHQSLPDTEVFRLVSAYFSIYGYEILQHELSGIKEVRFLFGDPASVGELDPGRKAPKSFDLSENGLAPNHELQQKHLARQCASWIKSRRVNIRSISQANFLHGKMYLTESKATNSVAVVGSSNFTRSGLGCGTSANLEINLATSDQAACVELQKWFDRLWANKELTREVKPEVLDALNRIGQDHAPERIYYKTLYNWFHDDIEARQSGERQLSDTHVYDTVIWNTLYAFQKDGAKSVIARLLRHNGCILADSVGLGKTYTALAVIKFFELRNERVLVLCPKKLRDNWALYLAYMAQVNNPFARDRFGYTLLSHTDLSRDTGQAGDIDLAPFNWRHFDLVVIDESHNFRNATVSRRDEAGKIIRRSRYERLLEEVIRQGARTKVLMLSATPVNTSLIDLRNQIYLMTEKREDVFQDSLGIGHIGALLGQAQKAFHAWESAPAKDGKKDKAVLLEKLGPDFFRLLGGVSISRSRRQIKTFYAEEMSRVGEFPTQQPPQNHYPPTDLQSAFSYKELSTQIEQFALSIYRPSRYVASEEARQRLEKEKQETHFNQEDRERYLIGMMRVNFLKRLESSAHSLTATLARTIGKIDALLDKIERYEQKQTGQDARADILPDDDEDDDEFLINRARHPYHLQDLDLPRWKQDLRQDRTPLVAALKQVKAITPERDGKLRELRQCIRQKMESPTTDKDGQPNRKLLIFTTFKDTAAYLYKNLSDLATELDLNMAMVAGDATRTTFGKNNFNAILTHFAPRARGRAAGTSGEIDVLIATDCISEGQNLQDCDTVLNYDIHWNPVRIIQRFGRIDRIGSRNTGVRMLNYWPTKDMDVYLRLQSRVAARMALADAAASGHDDPLNESQVQTELNFRDQQLHQLREEILDLDELSDGVVMSDFTLDYFFAQLLHYLEKKGRNWKQSRAAPTR